MGKCADSSCDLQGGSAYKGKADGISTRSAISLVLSVLKRTLKGLQDAEKISSLVESLIWPFVARRSLRKEWFSQHELDRFVHSMRKTAVNIQSSLSEDNREQSYIKYWTDRYLCQVMSDTARKDSFPDAEGWMDKTPLFVGWCKRFLLRQLMKRDMSFFYSLQKGIRKMWPSLGEIKKRKALLKHAERLSTFRGFVGEQLTEAIDLVSSEVVALAAKDGTKFMPSGSACSQASRREGGALSLFKHLPPQNVCEVGKIGKLRYLNTSVDNWRRDTFSESYEYCREHLGDVEEEGQFQLLTVYAVAIPEPGKFRMITKGNGYLYSALQPLQGVMLDAWKKHPASTMRDEDLSDKIRRMDEEVKFPFWISVDYEAATDLLKRDATYAAFRRWESAPFFDLGWYSLGPGLVRYPDGSCIEGLEGQFMGHPLSFPLLCIINLAVYRLSVKIWVGRDKKNRIGMMKSLLRNVLVNGDDMLFKGDMELYEIFSEVSAQAGFKKSQGKNYVSPDCCLINSQIFRRVNSRMERFGYLNMKMVKGTSLKGGDSTATPTQIAKELSKMVSRCLWTNCAIPAALSRWDEEWLGVRYRPNWYLPVNLGGFGLDPRFGPERIHVTRSQRLLAARFVHDPSLALYRSGMTLPAMKVAGALANWRVVTGDYVRGPDEMSGADLRDSWLERIAYAGRAMEGAKEVSDAVLMKHIFKRDYRLKPMSIEGIERYRGAQLFASKLPTCPPIGIIGRRLLHEVYIPDRIHWSNELVVAGVRSGSVDDLYRRKSPLKEVMRPWYDLDATSV